MWLYYLFGVHGWLLLRLGWYRALSIRATNPRARMSNTRTGTMPGRKERIAGLYLRPHTDRLPASPGQQVYRLIVAQAGADTVHVLIGTDRLTGHLHDHVTGS